MDSLKIYQEIELPDTQTQAETQTVPTRQIILYNDDINTFDHVIALLIRICEHSEEPAEQCALLVHYTGKCSVYNGELEKLQPKCLQLLDAGLSAEIV